MALTVSNASPKSEDVWGRHRIRVAKVTFNATYPAGGESFTPADVGLASFDWVQASVDAADASGRGHVVQFDYTNNKLMVFVEESVAAGGPLVENAVADISFLDVRVLCVGD